METPFKIVSEHYHDRTQHRPFVFLIKNNPLRKSSGGSKQWLIQKSQIKGLIAGSTLASYIDPFYKNKYKMSKKGAG